MSLTLEQLNAATLTEAAQMLAGIYEHSPWIAEAALAQRPFRSLAHLKHAHGRRSVRRRRSRTGRCAKPRA